jgi:hypothetical protein
LVARDVKFVVATKFVSFGTRAKFSGLEEQDTNTIRAKPTANTLNVLLIEIFIIDF